MEEIIVRKILITLFTTRYCFNREYHKGIEKATNAVGGWMPGIMFIRVLLQIETGFRLTNCRSCSVGAEGKQQGLHGHSSCFDLVEVINELL